MTPFELYSLDAIFVQISQCTIPSALLVLMHYVRYLIIGFCTASSSSATNLLIDSAVSSKTM